MVDICWTFLFLFLSALSVQAETWHPFLMKWDRAPVNLSFLLDPPAGKHGFLGVKGNRFVFEDGAEFRIWGTTLTGSGCFPPPDRSPAIAERLYRFGINLVRFHQLDADWADPNLFSRDGEKKELLNPQAMDRLDYFLYQLESRGIYAWLDGLSARRLRSGEGIESGNLLPPGWKGYIYIDPELQRLYQQYLQALWSHRNRYTGRQYRDSPSIVLSELFHDNNLKLDQPRLQPYAGRFLDSWNRYQVERGKEKPLLFDWKTPSADMQRFLARMMGDTITGFFNFLRGFSVKAAMGSTNAILSLSDYPIASALDFVHAESSLDLHATVKNVNIDRRMSDTDLSREGNLFSDLAFRRLENKPFIVSKWGDSWPNRFRAEMPLWMAAMAGFQDWQGCISSNYCSFFDPEMESSSAPLESFNDPCFWGLMPAAALLFHRNGVPSARQSAIMAVAESQLFQDNPITPAICRTTHLVDTRRVAVKIGTRATGKSIFSPTQPEEIEPFLLDLEPKAGIRRDSQRGLVSIDAPICQAFIGRINLVRWGELEYVDVRSEEDFAAVSINSLDDKPVNRSKELWVTIVSQAQQQEFRSIPIPDTSYRIHNTGNAPVTIRETPVRIWMTTEWVDWVISPVDGNGNINNPISYQWEDGRISFRAGVHGTMFYRLSCPVRSEERSRK